MPVQTDEEYFQSRVAIERQLAAEASSAEAAAMHASIAAGYEVLVWQEQARRRLEPPMPAPRTRS